MHTESAATYTNGDLEHNMKSLFSIETEMQELKAAGLTTKAKRTQYNQLKSLFSKTYSSAKERVMEFEKDNRSYLVLLRSTNGFYKMFEHSALFYVQDLAPKLNLAANLQLDTDFAVKSELGFVPIREPKKLIKPLSKLKITQAPVKDESGNFLLFKLPWEFDDKQITKMIDAGQLRLQHFNHLVMVDNVIPVLFLRLEELHLALYQNVRRMSGPMEREAYGLPLLTLATELQCLYFEFSNGKLKTRNFSRR